MSELSKESVWLCDWKVCECMDGCKSNWESDRVDGQVVECVWVCFD